MICPKAESAASTAVREPRRDVALRRAFSARSTHSDRADLGGTGAARRSVYSHLDVSVKRVHSVIRSSGSDPGSPNGNPRCRGCIPALAEAIQAARPDSHAHEPDIGCTTHDRGRGPRPRRGLI